MAARKLTRAYQGLEEVQANDDQNSAEDFAALVEAQCQPHIAVIWRGEEVVFLEEHPTERAASAAMIGALLAMEDREGVHAYTQAA